MYILSASLRSRDKEDMEMRATKVLLAYAWAALPVLFLPLSLLYVGTWALKRLPAVLFTHPSLQNRLILN
jgi:hypothetical protein